MQHALLSRFIGPTQTMANTDLGKETLNWVADQIHELRPQDWRIAITGPPQSGKSTILELTTLLFLEKLLLSEDCGDYLIVAFNWNVQEFEQDTLFGIYQVFIETTLGALRLARPSLVPVIDILQEWFLRLLSHRGFPPLPGLVVRFEGFPHDAVLSIARDLHSAWFGSGNLEHFVFAVTRLPRMLAGIFNFESVVYVYDHFDAAVVMLTGDGRFPDSQPVLFSHYLCEAAADGPFLVASKSDQEFVRGFEITNLIAWTTERIIGDTVEQNLCVCDPPFVLKYEHCRGCPGYCAIYLELCSLAVTAEERKIPRHKSKYEPVVDRSRQSVLVDQFLRLCLLIEGSSSGTLDVDSLNRLSHLRAFDVCVR
jgi:hypothetical protein